MQPFIVDNGPKDHVLLGVLSWSHALSSIYATCNLFFEPPGFWSWCLPEATEQLRSLPLRHMWCKTTSLKNLRMSMVRLTLLNWILAIILNNYEDHGRISRRMKIYFSNSAKRKFSAILLPHVPWFDSSSCLQRCLGVDDVKLLKSPFEWMA